MGSTVTRPVRRRRLLVPGLVAALLALAAGLGHTQKPIVITGASTLAPVIAEIAKAYEARYPGTRIEVQSGGSSRGIADVRSGIADIGMVSRPVKSGESDLHAVAIARDGIGMIVNKQNPVNAITTEQVVGIYTGAITNWKQLSGPDAQIIVVHKAEGRSTLELFVDFFKIDNRKVRASVIIGDNQQGIKTVAGNPNAIGYVSIGSAEYDVRSGTAIKLLSLDGRVPSSAAIARGAFPLSRTLNLVTKSAAAGPVLDFINFVRSRDGQSIVKTQYFIPIGD